MFGFGVGPGIFVGSTQLFSISTVVCVAVVCVVVDSSVEFGSSSPCIGHDFRQSVPDSGCASSRVSTKAES